MNQPTIMKLCIFCLKPKPDECFNKEHVIPECIGGRLILSGIVCTNCNSNFGELTDHQVLKVGDILNAYHSLGMNDRREEIVRHNFNLTLNGGDGNQIQARLKNNVPLPITKHVSNDTVLFPADEIDGEFQNKLQKMGKAQSIPPDQINNEHLSFKAWFNEASSGEVYHMPRLGMSHTKDQRDYSLSLEPKQEPEPERLIAKIAYEFFALTNLRYLATTPRLRPSLLAKISGEDYPHNSLSLGRILPKTKDYEPFHFVRFYISSGFPRFEIGFFKSIKYGLMSSTPIPEDYFSDFAQKIKSELIVGIQFENSLDKNIPLKFWALHDGGRTTALAWNGGML